MKAELLCRFTKEISKDLEQEIQEELATKRMLHGDDFDEEEEREKILESKDIDAFDYVPMVMDLKDVMFFNKVDDTHTCVRTPIGAAFTLKIDYPRFKDVYEQQLGIKIQDYTTTNNNTITIHL